jgi:hypothetical protein
MNIAIPRAAPEPRKSPGQIRKRQKLLAPNAATPVAPKQAEAQVSRESLGTETIDGIVIRGTRTTTVYPAGSFGNDRPVTVVRENWLSPELLVGVMIKISDPRTGEVTSRLTNISRSDPDTSLFRYLLVTNS